MLNYKNKYLKYKKKYLELLGGADQQQRAKIIVGSSQKLYNYTLEFIELSKSLCTDEQLHGYLTDNFKKLLENTVEEEQLKAMYEPLTAFCTPTQREDNSIAQQDSAMELCRNLRKELSTYLAGGRDAVQYIIKNKPYLYYNYLLNIYFFYIRTHLKKMATLVKSDTSSITDSFRKSSITDSFRKLSNFIKKYHDIIKQIDILTQGKGLVILKMYDYMLSQIYKPFCVKSTTVLLSSRDNVGSEVEISASAISKDDIWAIQEFTQEFTINLPKEDVQQIRKLLDRMAHIHMLVIPYVPEIEA